MSCSKPVTPKVTSKTLIDPPSPVTAQIAFHRVFVQAKAWSADSQLLKISNFNLKELPSNSGKCAVWQAVLYLGQKENLEAILTQSLNLDGVFVKVYE